MQERSIVHVFFRTAARRGDADALFAKVGGTWRPTTWRRYAQRVRAVAKGLLHLGLPRGGAVAITGANSPEWLITDLAAMAAGGVPAPIYPTVTAEQAAYIAGHCEATILVADTMAQIDKLRSQKDTRLPRLQHYVVMQPHHDGGGEGVIDLAALEKLGEQVGDEVLDQRIQQLEPGGLATLIYTSGTTGPPKGVMLSHDNLVFTAEVAVRSLDVGQETIASYLPLSHIAEQMFSIHLPATMGGTVWFVENLDKLGENLREIRPTAFLGVPRVWEKIQAKMMEAAASNPPLRRKIAAWAKKVGAEAIPRLQVGKDAGLVYALADKIVYSKVRARLGLDRCRFFVTSAAPIARSTMEFFHSLGIPILEVYGMTECTGPHTISLPGAYRIGKVGRVMQGAELRIAEDGEICMRGRHVCLGYFKEPAATAETIDQEGWLHSGDVGQLDAEGFLQITDRKKDLLITAGGKNVAPQNIEALLKGIPGVAAACVLGDRMKYLAALLTLDPENAPRVAQQVGARGNKPAELAGDPAFIAHVQAGIDRVNGQLAKYETIKKFKILPVEFTIDGGELTPTMKMKRKVVREKYATEIAALFPSEGAELQA